MKIEIAQLEHSTNKYYVKITERLNEPDKNHRTDRVITSPGLCTEQEAQNWLIRWFGLRK